MSQFVIPFVSRSDARDIRRWIDALSSALPLCRIVPSADLTPEERACAEIAIVADPEPSELTRLPSLKWVQSLWAGVERLMAELPPSDLQVVRLVDPMLAQTMANAVLSWTLYLYRDMPRYRSQQAEKVWRQHILPNVADVTVGILGLGALGTEAVRALTAQGFPVVGWSRTPASIDGVACLSGPDGLDELLARSNIVVVLLPLTSDTRGLLGADRLARMRPGAAIINFGRGPIIDSPALVGALDSGHLSHAVLDVFEKEPLPAESPFWSHPSVTVLPHISAPTNLHTASRVAAANIDAFLRDGTIPQGVDRTRGY